MAPDGQFAVTATAKPLAMYLLQTPYESLRCGAPRPSFHPELSCTGVARKETAKHCVSTQDITRVIFNLKKGEDRPRKPQYLFCAHAPLRIHKAWFPTTTLRVFSWLHFGFWATVALSFLFGNYCSNMD